MLDAAGSQDGSKNPEPENIRETMNSNIRTITGGRAGFVPAIDEEAGTAQTTDSPSIFAPGPWHIGEANPWLVYAADGYAVADLRTYHGRHPDPKADARLIAAAPEMLEALERIREYQGRSGEDDPTSIAADMLAKIYSENPKD